LVNRGGDGRDQSRMTKLFGALLFGLIRVLVADLISQAALKFCAWLDAKIPGRWPRVILGGLMGLAAYFIFPVIMGIIGL
jgi:hypothetical protein